MSIVFFDCINNTFVGILEVCVPLVPTGKITHSAHLKLSWILNHRIKQETHYNKNTFPEIMVIYYY